MRRELSAGGVVIGADGLAAVQPQGRPAGHWVLPKGLIDPGERVVDAAVREVLEETGLVAEPVERLATVRYTYARDGERIFKVVTFWLMRPVGGELGAIDGSMVAEVAANAWLPPADAPRLLAYGGERRVVADYLRGLDAHAT